MHSWLRITIGFAVFIQEQCTHWTEWIWCTKNTLEWWLWWTCQLILESILLKSKVILRRKDSVKFIKEILHFFHLFLFDTSNTFLLTIQILWIRTHLNNRISLLVNQIGCNVRWYIFQHRCINLFIETRSVCIWIILWLKFPMDTSSWFSWMNSSEAVLLRGDDVIGVTLSQATEELVLIVFPIMRCFLLLKLHVHQNILFTVSIVLNRVQTFYSKILFAQLFSQKVWCWIHREHASVHCFDRSLSFKSLIYISFYISWSWISFCGKLKLQIFLIMIWKLTVITRILQIIFLLIIQEWILEVLLHLYQSSWAIQLNVLLVSGKSHSLELINVGTPTVFICDVSIVCSFQWSVCFLFLEKKLMRWIVVKLVLAWNDAWIQSKLAMVFISDISLSTGRNGFLLIVHIASSKCLTLLRSTKLGFTTI
mgnify:CR=1 FL=1